ncbi:Uncharacterised protein [Streptococcus suis]|uniref:Uncharacterized protein n=1 Tax=Streptococcus suis TaxID=1307 RepID=A0A0Z8GL46_STRSU|nr:hypothetical protein [Streptococcus suis]NQH40112.1 hypothetical protein [Streptococcus suis]CYV00758.1 Uncharacterised protein [Streptococcus suis]
MDKQRIIDLLNQLSPILAGKEETIGKALTEKLQSALLVTKEDVASKDGVALATICVRLCSSGIQCQLARQ